MFGRTTLPRRRRLIVYGALTLCGLLTVAAAARALRDDGTTSGGAPQGAALRTEHESSSRQRVNTTGEVILLANTGQLRAEQDMRILRVAPMAVSPELDVLNARVLRLWQASTKLGHNRQPHGICTAEWPPPGFGPTHEPSGMSVARGDLIAVLFYVRGDPTQPGDHVLRGVTVEYEVGGRTRQQSFDHYAMHLYVRASATDFPEGPWGHCTPRAYPWFEPGNPPTS